MTVSIVACGNSAKEWFNTPCDYSIGVNDCFKWGRNVDTLLIINAPALFQPRQKNGYKNRLEVIKSSTPSIVITDQREDWKRHFPSINVEGIEIKRFNPKHFRKGELYFSKTSPFVALSYALNINATEVILWGVDLLDHPVMKPEYRETAFEIEQYLELIKIMGFYGVKVFIGNENTALAKYLPVYEKSSVEK